MKKNAPTSATPQVETPDWYDLLEQAVQAPAELAEAHRYFHNYSLSNRWLASTQLRSAGLPLLPINTFKNWLNFNRPVQKGEKASIALIVPVPIKKKKESEGDKEEKEIVFTKYILRRHWFHLNQTAGDEFSPEPNELGDWSITAAQNFLEIEEKPWVFDSITDNRVGEAVSKTISVSPLAPYPVYIRLREMAKVLLGHTDVAPGRAVPVEQNLRDIEADAAAYLCAATLGLAGLDDARHRLSAVCEASSVPDKCAHRAFSVADKLINAGYC